MRRLICLSLTILLLAIAFLTFSPSIGGAAEILEKAPQAIKFSRVESSPVLVKIRVKVFEADMGFSREFLGNETDYQLRPVKGALVLIMDGAAITTGPSYILRGSYYGFTDANGEAILSSPIGNLSIMINPRPYHRDPRCFWRSYVKIDGNETIIVRFFLYRLNPIEIKVDMKVFEPKNHVTLRFKLPLNGSYYIGAPVLVYYTSIGDVRIYREDLGSYTELKGYPRGAMSFWRNPRIYYLEEQLGGARVIKVLRVKGLSAYISPSMTYLPVERVVLEELEAES